MGYTTEWRLYRVRYASDVVEDYVARSVAEVDDVRIALVGPDEEAPESIREYPADERVTVRDEEEGAKLTHTADEWAASCARPECIASTEA